MMRGPGASQYGTYLMTVYQYRRAGRFMVQHSFRGLFCLACVMLSTNAIQGQLITSPSENECVTSTAQFEEESGFMPVNEAYRNPEAMGAVTDLHVVFSNHLDVGFNVRAWCDGDGGACTSTSPSANGRPCRPWAHWVLGPYHRSFNSSVRSPYPSL